MRVLSVAFPLLPVRSDSGGGAEQILHLLERGLSEQGHESVVIAAPGSDVVGRLIEAMAAPEEITDALRSEAQEIHRCLLERVLREETYDIVHFHGLDFNKYLPRNHHGARLLATLHLPIDWYAPGILALSGVHFNCVSNSQLSTQGSGPLPVVSNGIDLSGYDAGTRTPEDDHLLFIGRVCPEKGTDMALRVAHALDMRLTIAGPVHPFRSHRDYFATQIAPLLDDRRLYIGPVDVCAKAGLLRRARCLLVPSLAAETSSLVAMEAAAAGTPVVALGAGALPEVVQHGESGFIAAGEDELGRYVRRANEISASTCAARAAKRFDARRMVGDYIRLYAALS